ncbi:hypothetical protein SUDANB121_05592 [Nocardiopsis dassonvillei]|uniref:hypothetical protein n=1 Tax=Nocardiopsis dassonvillei TaxID=2014 RepID=UPI003F550B85
MPSHRPDREDLLRILATFTGRPPEEVGENIDSMHLAWIVHGCEQEHGFLVDIDDPRVNGARTVDELAAAFRAPSPGDHG